jgi:hypothetical protein
LSTVTEPAHELMSLRTPEREIYVQVEGGLLRVNATGPLSADELRRLLAGAAALLQRVRLLALEPTE